MRKIGNGDDSNLWFLNIKWFWSFFSLKVGGKRRWPMGGGRVGCTVWPCGRYILDGIASVLMVPMYNKYL